MAWAKVMGSLEMGVAGHNGVQIGLCLADEGLFQVHQHSYDHGNLFFHKQTEVQGHLVVPAAGGVQPFAGGADALGEQHLHVHVDVLAVLGKLHLAVLNFGQEDL